MPSSKKDGEKKRSTQSGLSSLKARRCLVVQTLFTSLLLTLQFLTEIADHAQLCYYEYRLHRQTSCRSAFSHQSLCGSFASSRFPSVARLTQQKKSRTRTENGTCKINKAGGIGILKRLGPDAVVSNEVQNAAAASSIGCERNSLALTQKERKKDECLFLFECRLN